MFLFEKESDFVQDREDLIAILRMRFGDVPPSIIERIYDFNDLNTLERLILVAANVPDFDIFLEEMGEDQGSFKITGERFNPINGGDYYDN